ncbi:helix-turn-helix transcriptional regulator [Flavobacterium sp. '19STA2R22 D10 B1']|uniref:helix-turn-helix transcriptional regulator n=1 Tax=Flavobacterium aerium TaxID=3037261 RepID=UPI00278BF5AE|nr:metalloregulator ArsR/SmtB family transcription factor [Flavobacterium sp. '19STA2R22 D10 B1']
MMTTDRFLILLKKKGPLTAKEIATEFNITGEAVRQQLNKLGQQDLVSSTSITQGVGRPQQYYSLLEKSNQHFPDTHAELTVQLIETIQKVLGNNALDDIIDARAKEIDLRYFERINQAESTIEGKLNCLVAIRNEEGYMAEWKKEENNYLLIENHCPICVAATVCQGFCRTEINTFQKVLGNEVEVKRIDHIVLGARRCAYQITTVG